ncbi:hypothetical protein ALI144C_48725 [Actinosynnema sp. ALI-1.44]|uniref:hypothetical protein n=1 Tax=Actinosynnema sp. ALI-1.44 TaxID=1933779 RepID=UPI00097C1CB8|nr:hypothetical protein [Actinosynnema sp. ALI-1.44]ONI70529.1 hypothetical protein ALI144C_48725 [Actinosynnema sp. ALI-1.44]
MSTKIPALVHELKALRGGLGVEDPHLVARAGSAVRRASGVADGESPAIAREKIRMWLERLIAQLPDAAARTGRAVFGFDGPGDQPYLARLRALGQAVDREVRTMQRRADQIVARIAELALTQSSATDPHAGEPWHTALVQVDLVLDQPEIEVFENRRIISHTNGLTEIRHSLTIPQARDRTDHVDLDALGITVLRGGDMSAPPRMVSTNRLEFALRPPQPLAPGDDHEFFFRLRLPEMSPFYVCTPRFGCDEFHLRVRFGRDRVPDRIWLIDGELSMEAADPVPSARPCVRTAPGRSR